MNTKYYTGIGSRETPLELQDFIINIAWKLDDLGYTLRSGGASGADSFFELGAIKKEIYLPWAGFNGNTSQLCAIGYEAHELAKKFHPAWNKLSVTSRKLMARSGYQVLGQDLNTPSQFLVCWTPGGKEVGGTSQAIRIAKAWGIPIFNLALQKDLERIKKIL